ncbi:MAG: hypothetical protein RJB11_3073, partial [Planctomycetota bacterium]
SLWRGRDLTPAGRPWLLQVGTKVSNRCFTVEKDLLEFGEAGVKRSFDSIDG